MGWEKKLVKKIGILCVRSTQHSIYIFKRPVDNMNRSICINTLAWLYILIIVLFYPMGLVAVVETPASNNYYTLLNSSFPHVTSVILLILMNEINITP